MIILIVSQIVFSFSRTLNMRYTANNRVVLAMITSFLIKVSWLIGAAIGVESVIKGDWISAGVYVVSGLIGEWLSFKVKI